MILKITDPEDDREFLESLIDAIKNDSGDDFSQKESEELNEFAKIVADLVRLDKENRDIIDITIEECFHEDSEK